MLVSTITNLTQVRELAYFLHAKAQHLQVFSLWLHIIISWQLNMAVFISLQISPTSENAWNICYTVSKRGHQMKVAATFLKIHFWIDFIHLFNRPLCYRILYMSILTMTPAKCTRNTCYDGHQIFPLISSTQNLLLLLDFESNFRLFIHYSGNSSN